MALKNRDGTFSCSHCYKIYNTPIKADTCRDSHDLVYIPMSTKELNGLLHFIAFGEYKFLEDSLRDRLMKYARSTQTREGK